MQYASVIRGQFCSRPNRFLAVVRIGGQEEIVHVKNTGRCRELLIPECTVYLSRSDNPNRKTKYDLIAVEKQREGKPPLLINLDSQIPNAAAAEWLETGSLFSANAVFRREVTHGSSRFDFSIIDGNIQSFLEVKGVTLEQDGIALFPDAPTLRGVKHLQELTACQQAEIPAYLLLVIQMKEIRAFRPNDAMHPQFGEALRRAAAAGVTLLARDCIVTPDSITIDAPVPIQL
ncbi:DNA/RNA nuclease SfsA [uncultured Ruminococcus sp.]|uniref:DNA/RNA nuclease SfsA n=1 Tax=uncultured Ruminococcus sp. TaxID=165186 RepID=UPI0026740848|nr:DNA/RNA nuclease SfsA [uncultured Ruminococcus sp.]